MKRTHRLVRWGIWNRKGKCLAAHLQFTRRAALDIVNTVNAKAPETLALALIIVREV